MDKSQAEQIIRDTFGTEPLQWEKMTVGRINSVYIVTLPEREVVIRMNENPFVLKGTSRNIAILRELGLPVPQVIAEDLTKERYPFHYMLLDKIPGRDLRFELESMTEAQTTKLAETIISFQRKVAELPIGTGYGWVPIHDKGEFADWTSVIKRELDNGLPNVQNLLPAAEIAAIVREAERLAPYFEGVRPVPFLDDVTTKNVMMADGELQGIVDLDCVCYGDPLFQISLTQTAIIADLPQVNLFYIEELCRAGEVTGERRRIVDYYSLLFAMNFLAYFGEDVDGYKRTASYIQRWTAALS